ncbi:TPA: phage DNA ejection protein [Yersinia enterocolitica]
MATSQFGGVAAPINYYETMIPNFRNEALQETQNKIGQNQVIAQSMQNQQAQQENERKMQFYDAIGNATPDQLPGLRKQFPEFTKSIQDEIGIQGAEHAAFVNGALSKLSVAAASGDPQQVMQSLSQSGPALASVGVSPEQAFQLYQSNPQQFNGLLNATRLATLPIDKQFDIQGDQAKLQETIRSNRAGEGLQARGQNITLRGQDISAQNSQRSAGGSVPSSVREYEYVKNLPPDERKEFLKLTKGGKSSDLQSAQLSSGATVMIDPTPLGAGSNKFYKGYDADGKVITVPVSSLSTSMDSSGSASQGQMNSDIDLILKSSPRETGPLTGITGGTGRPSITADVGSRISNPKTREIFNAANRIQGNMQNQGVAAARSMGASGINTVAEAKMYFQSMPQIDYSSRNSLIKSMENVKKYTDEHNSVNKVNYSNQQQPAAQQPVTGGGFSNLWGG